MSRSLRGTSAAVLSALVLACLPASAALAAPESSEPPVVHTGSGAVSGVQAGGVDGYLGIPYAAPPVGELRWSPPQPPAPWDGVRPADAYGNRCPATESTNGPRSETEDCLFVNVQRPAGTTPEDRLPVYVFIHGGGLVNGSSNQADMAAIVAATGIVGVTMNYRLGLLGFLGHPELTARQGESGNYGLMDQQAALRWVQENIAAFGGDPARVTIGGESAGGWSVCTHLVAPGSRGLFAGAMIQSGSCPSRSQDAADATGQVVAQAVGCSPFASAVACLRGKPVGELIDAPTPLVPPVAGTPFLPTDPRVAVGTGDLARVPVVVGATLHEGRTFAAGNIGWTREQYETWIRDSFAEHADAVLSRYPWPADADQFTPAYLSGAILTDAGLAFGIGGCPNRALTRDLAAHVPTWAYEFAARTGPGLQPIPGYEWGAGHAAELAYLFPSFDNGVPIAPTFDAGEQQLAAEMKQYWAAFVQRGDPGVPGQAAWPSYDAEQVVLSLQPAGGSTAVPDAALAEEHQCAFWDPLTAGGA
ncbi:carboxylesterase/lipase family protein [Geodermatophilus sp. URMC 61]|uniref:carboxylesterase/lipase family protein n=1 Tax=Geodermatophilus sp. URMC 61 TaxID=3423411 RepID=UPI00406CC24C